MSDSNELHNALRGVMASAMVMLTPGGFCLLETRLVGAKSSIRITIKKAVDDCAAGLFFWVVGFGFVFGTADSFLADDRTPWERHGGTIEVGRETRFIQLPLGGSSAESAESWG